MSTLKVTNLQHPSAASANVTLDASGNADFNGKNLAGVASVNGGALNSSNILINGAFTIAQRATSATGVASSAYHTVDRWNYADDSTGVLTMSQDTNAPDGFGYSFKSLVTTADTSIGTTAQVRVEQRIESSSVQHLKYGTSDAQQVTVSFWVKTNKTGNWSVGLYMEGSGANISQAYTVNSADTWEYKTVTFAGNTANSMSGNLRLWFTFAAGSDRTSGTSNTWSTDTGHRAVGQAVNLFDATSNYWQITGVMLETGDTATSYPHEDVGTTLQKCQRYYWNTENYKYNGSYLGAWKYGSSWYLNIDLPVEMRAVPTATYSYNTNYIIWSSTGSSTYTDSTAPITLTTGTTHLRLHTGGSTRGTGGDAGMMTIGDAGVSNGRLQFYLDAEL